MDEDVLERVYLEHLDEQLIEYLASKRSIDYQSAMDIYYRSDLAAKIHEGRYGIQYLDYKALEEILEKTEPGLFNN